MNHQGFLPNPSYGKKVEHQEELEETNEKDIDKNLVFFVYFLNKLPLVMLSSHK